jgi:tRNA(Ile)-lysidine synthase
MIEPGMTVVAGVSGGADSVCLLYVLKQYRTQVPCELHVVHVEHGIRGEESLGDAAFTQQLCRTWEIPFHLVPVDVQTIAKERNLSVEEAGRIERYRIFEELCQSLGGQRIAVAHNQNDQAETVLWNLARGSGLKGLGGIRPVRGRIIRPLLETSRERIEHLLREAGLVWRTDRTNLEQEYTRNRVRLSVLPQLQRELNARAPEHIAMAAGKLQQVQDFLERMTDEAQKSCICFGKTGEDTVINLEPFLAQDPLIRKELLRRALERSTGLKDVGTIHIDSLMNLANMDCGKSVSLPGKVRAVRENGMIHLMENAPETAQEMQEYSLPVPGVCEAGRYRIRIELLENSPSLWQEIITEKKYTKWLSYDTINSDIVFRTRRPGDYLIVNSEGGRKKIKDYLIDRKVPRGQRDHLWMLADGSHILWVQGARISEAAKVHRETRKVMKIQMEELSNEGKGQNSFAGTGSKSADCRDCTADQ